MVYIIHLHRATYGGMGRGVPGGRGIPSCTREKKKGPLKIRAKNKKGGSNLTIAGGKISKKTGSKMSGKKWQKKKKNQKNPYIFFWFFFRVKLCIVWGVEYPPHTYLYELSQETFFEK